MRIYLPPDVIANREGLFFSGGIYNGEQRQNHSAFGRRPNRTAS